MVVDLDGIIISDYKRSNYNYAALNVDYDKLTPLVKAAGLPNSLGLNVYNGSTLITTVNISATGNGVAVYGVSWLSNGSQVKPETDYRLEVKSIGYSMTPFIIKTTKLPVPYDVKNTDNSITMKYHIKFERFDLGLYKRYNGVNFQTIEGYTLLYKKSSDNDWINSGLQYRLQFQNNGVTYIEYQLNNLDSSTLYDIQLELNDIGVEDGQYSTNFVYNSNKTEVLTVATNNPHDTDIPKLTGTISKTSNSVTFSWLPIPEAESYDIYYGTDGSTEGTVNTQENTVTINNLSSATRYYFDLQAKFSATDEGKILSFVITTPA